MCYNFNCPLNKTCKFDIWMPNAHPCQLDGGWVKNYISAKESIYQKHVEQSTRLNRNPMPQNIYFEE